MIINVRDHMVTLSRKFLYKLYDEIRENIKGKLNARFNSSDDPAFISYLLEYYAKREYQDIYTDRSKKGISEEEIEEMKNWAINYLSTCHKEETIDWAINYTSNYRPLVLLDNPNNPIKGTLIFQGNKRDFIFPHKDKDESHIKEEVTRIPEKNIQDPNTYKELTSILHKSIESTKRKELPPGKN